MSRYHDRALALLEGVRLLTAAPELTAWAAKNDVALPAAYLEWAQLDPGGALLAKYSNMDRFWIDRPSLEATPGGGRGLGFCQENQGNWDMIAALDDSDDPPVYIVWGPQYGSPVYSDRFSDYVYAQIFDWQYFLEFDGSFAPSVTDHGYLALKTERCLDTLRSRFTPSVTTRVDNGTTEYRFLKSPKERLKACVHDGQRERVGIIITGENKHQWKQLEAELRDLLADDILEKE